MKFPELTHSNWAHGVVIVVVGVVVGPVPVVVVVVVPVVAVVGVVGPVPVVVVVAPATVVVVVAPATVVAVVAPATVVVVVAGGTVAPFTQASHKIGHKPSTNAETQSFVFAFAHDASSTHLEVDVHVPQLFWHIVRTNAEAAQSAA